MCRGVRVNEYAPIIEKWAPVPGKPESISNRAVLPLYVGWQALKVVTRIPSIVSSYRYDATWINKELIAGYPTLEGFIGKPLVSDVDDAIWLTPPFGRKAAKKLARHSTVVVAGNSFLAEWFDNYTERVEVIPTAIDASVYCPHPQGMVDRIFTIGWIGSQGNLPYLLGIEDALAKFLKEHPASRLLVVSDKEPSFTKLPNDRIEFIYWTAEQEVNLLRKMDVGLMPLEDSEWARGKCSFKMLQYMSVGVPVVVSPVGMNQEVLKMGNVGFSAMETNEWIEALSWIYDHKEEAFAMGSNGREVVLSAFDAPLIANKLADVFKSL